MLGNRHGQSAVAAVMAGLGLMLAAGAAAAQGRCTMGALVGTYAFEFRGSSTFVLGTAPPRHWSVTTAPFIFVGAMTLDADGTMQGQGWAILGQIGSGLTALPMTGVLTELDERTCTAVLDWMGTPVPGGTPGRHRDRFVFVENGEFRSLLMQSPSGSMTWIGRGHRVPQAPVVACGPHLLKGEVLIQGEQLRSDAGAAAPANEGWMLRLTVAGDGSFTGTSYAKNPTYGESSVEGAFQVAGNCMVGLDYTVAGQPGFTHHGRGMIFHEGKSGFLIMPLETTGSDGVASRPAFARAEILSLGR